MRRKFLKTSALAAATGLTALLCPGRAPAAQKLFATTANGRRLATGPFKPTWHGTGSAILDNAMDTASSVGNRGGKPQLDNTERVNLSSLKFLQ